MKRRRGSLRTRLIVVALVAILPAVALAFSIQSRERAQARDRAVAQNQRLVRLAADQIADVFIGAERLHATLKGFPALMSDAAQCGVVLARVKRDHPGYNNIAIFDLDGTPFCAAAPIDPHTYQALRERAWFKRALASRTFSLGDYRAAPGRRGAIVVAEPIGGAAGEPLRLLASSLSIEALGHIARSAQIPSGASLTLLDANGTVLTRVPPSPAVIGTNVADRVASQPFHPANETIRDETVDGRGQLTVTERVDTGAPQQPLYMTLTVSDTVVFAEADRNFHDYLWVLLAVAIVSIGVAAVLGQVSVLRPVDQETLRTTRELRETEDRYRQIFQQHPHPMWVFDRHTLAFLEVNDAAVRQYGYSREEFLAMRITDIRPAEDVPLVVGQIEARHSQDWSRSSGWRHELKSGAIVDVEVTSHPFTFMGHDAFLVVAVDVTEKRSLEQQLRQAQKMEAIGQLAGGVAHDFNNLLTAIQGYSDLVFDTLAHDDPRRADVQEIQRAGKRAADLTRQLLAFSRKQVLSPRVLHAGDAIGQLAPMLRRLLGESIELRAIISNRRHIKVDPSQLDQVLLNLAVNASDAMERRGILTIETADVMLDEDFVRAHGVAMAPGPHVMIAVSDTGCGMDAETQCRIFEPFFTTKGKDRGTGLGLAMVYGIVKQSGGSIWVSSEVGKGTTFKLYLPSTPESVDAIPSASPAAAPQRGIESILLIEDEAQVREYAARVLRDLGYRVTDIDSPVAAVAYAREQSDRIHLVLTDVVMPTLSGPDAYSQIHQCHPEPAVLFMSGYADSSIASQGILDGAARCLQKPFSPLDLASRVRDALRT